MTLLPADDSSHPADPRDLRGPDENAMSPPLTGRPAPNDPLDSYVYGPVEAERRRAAHHTGMRTRTPHHDTAPRLHVVDARATRPVVLVTDFSPHAVEATPIADDDFEVADLDTLVSAHDFTKPFSAAPLPERPDRRPPATHPHDCCLHGH